jgi:hypothetical protein
MNLPEVLFVYRLNAIRTDDGSIGEEKPEMSGQNNLKLKARMVSAAGLFLLALAIPGSARAEDKTPLRIPKLSQAPKIDGVLDSPLWEQQALKIENFAQFTPKENGTPSPVHRIQHAAGHGLLGHGEIRGY